MLTIREIQQKLLKRKDILEDGWFEIEPTELNTSPAEPPADPHEEETATEQVDLQPSLQASSFEEEEQPASMQSDAFVQAALQAVQHGDEPMANAEEAEPMQKNQHMHDMPADSLQENMRAAESAPEELTVSAVLPYTAPQDEAEEMEIRTVGQMRRAIMDFPTSQAAATFFKCFADSTRLRLLQALSIREMCVSDLCETLELSQPAVSNHLRILNNQRIVQFRRSGKNVFYSLDEWHINAIIGMALEYLGIAFPEHGRKK